MPNGEYPGEIARKFIEKIGCLLEGTNGFHVFQTCYQAPDACIVQIEAEKIRFDMIVDKIITNNNPLGTEKKYFFCECKWRTSNADLKTQLKLFLEKALKTISQLQRQYGDNFGFIFFTNKPFGDPNELTKTAYLIDLLRLKIK